MNKIFIMDKVLSRIIKLDKNETKNIKKNII